MIGTGGSSDSMLQSIEDCFYFLLKQSGRAKNLWIGFHRDKLFNLYANCLDRDVVKKSNKSVGYS